MEEEEKAVQKKYYDHISIAKRTKQSVYFVAQHDKTTMLEFVLKDEVNKQIIILTKSKKTADELYFHLKDMNLKVFAVHGNHKPDLVQTTAQSFNNGELNILITTDMILQALELKDIETIINYDLPFDPTNYFKSLKLIDETGLALSFVSPQEEKTLLTIESMMKMEIQEQTIKNFQPTSHIPKSPSKKKKPRHKKTKIKTNKENI